MSKRAAGGAPRGLPGWLKVLYKARDNQDQHVYSDEEIVAIKDPFPKANLHFLIMPKVKDIAGISELEQSDVPLLKKMEKVGKELAQKYGSETTGKPGTVDNQQLQFRYGYHSIPSLAPLHLHAISIDMISDSLKTKKHYNSFTTGFFKDSRDIISELDSNGSVLVDKNAAEEALKGPLKCVHCNLELKNIPKLKHHLQNCNKTR